MKDHEHAKSRLTPPTGVSRPELAQALARDTLRAAFRCVPAERILVVTSDRAASRFVRGLGGTVEPDPGGGLNPAVEAGLHRVVQMWGSVPTGVLLGDLPALRPASLATALSACAEPARAFVPDLSGDGTVLLTARRAEDVRPRFGPDSARRHAESAVRLDLPLLSLRTDVDTRAALCRALDLGVGRYTRAVLEGAAPPTAGTGRCRPRRAALAPVAGWTDDR